MKVVSLNVLLYIGNCESLFDLFYVYVLIIDDRTMKIPYMPVLLEIPSDLSFDKCRNEL